MSLILLLRDVLACFGDWHAGCRVCPRLRQDPANRLRYTREAHPGEHYPHHGSMADKRHHAQAFRDHCKVRRQILLDDLDGSAHRAYGLLPNMAWVKAAGAARSAPSEDVGPRVPGNFYRTEDEESTG